MTNLRRILLIEDYIKTIRFCKTVPKFALGIKQRILVQRQASNCIRDNFDNTDHVHRALSASQEPRHY